MSDAPSQSSVAARAKARAKRVERGQNAEAEARKSTSRTSLQGMMQLPLLEALEAAGGAARPPEVYDRLADRMGVPDEVRNAKRTCVDGETYGVWAQQVRWARHAAVKAGLIHSNRRGIWELADPGYAKLLRARRGTALLIYSTDLGIAMWGHAEDIATTIPKNSVTLVFLSPPYPVLSGREYGKLGVPEWLSWMKRLTLLWRDLLTDDGSLVVNLGDVYVPGSPVLSPYVERYTLSCIDELNLHMPGRLPWIAPNKLGHIEWTGKRKIRPKGQMEHLLAFSKTTTPKWDLRRLPLTAYADATLRGWGKGAERGKEQRPSGHDLNAQAFAPTKGGALPGNVIVENVAPPSDTYMRRCRDAGLPLHPARFPAALPEKAILLTTDVGDVVYDPMSGSNVTGMVAEGLKRRWISSECVLPYVQGAAFRFEACAGFQRYPLPAGA